MYPTSQQGEVVCWAWICWIVEAAKRRQLSHQNSYPEVCLFPFREGVGDGGARNVTIAFISARPQVGERMMHPGSSSMAQHQQPLRLCRTQPRCHFSVPRNGKLQIFARCHSRDSNKPSLVSYCHAGEAYWLSLSTKYSRANETEISRDSLTAERQPKGSKQAATGLESLS